MTALEHLAHLTRVIGLALATTLLASAIACAAPQKSTAVIAYAQSGLPDMVVRVAQTRVEQLLVDSGVTVLDKETVDKLKAEWESLSDPGALITAEQFIEKADKYKFDTVYRVYVNGGTTPGLGDYYTATSSVDLRIVAADGNTRSVSGVPMGIRGTPPSDGLTVNAALTNAVQRAVDMTLTKAGINVADPTSARTFPITLVQDSGTVGANTTAVATSSPDIMRELAQSANLITGVWHNEEPTCTAMSPDKQLGAVGTYEKLTRPPAERRYGGKVHIIDATAKREFLVLDATRLVERTRTERGTSKTLACLFLGSWRYLAAVTGSYLVLWDIERGIELSRLVLPQPVEVAGLSLRRTTDNKTHIVVQSNAQNWTYSVKTNSPPK